MIKIYDIAKKCGLSSSTVSKALNNYSDVSSETRNKVNQVAKEMGYFPNSQARALVTKKTWNIGVIFADGSNSGITHYYFAQILNEFKKAVEDRGFDITFIAENLGSNSMSYLEHCNYRQVDAVFVACIDFTDPRIQELMLSDIPSIVIDYHFKESSVIYSDNYGGLYEIVKYLVDLGHKDIIYIHGALDSLVTRRRIKGYKDAMKDCHLEVTEESTIEGYYYDKHVTNARLSEVLQRETLPTAIIFPDDYTAIWGMNLIKKRGLRIPEDISVVGFDGIELGEMFEPSLTTVKQDTKEIAIQAADHLFKAVNEGNLDLTQITIGVSLVEGNSSTSIR